MIIINKSERPVYSTLARRILHSHGKSCDKDMGDFHAAILRVLKDCNTHNIVRLNASEKAHIERLLELDREGQSFQTKAPHVETPEEAFKRLAEKERPAKIAEAKAIEEAFAREAAITNETTYMSNKDRKMASVKADSLKGIVSPRKLDPNQTSPSLKDLMQDNQFIEENLKNGVSHVPTAFASSEGWEGALSKKEAVAEKTTDIQDTPTAAEKPAKVDKTDKADKTEKGESRRRRKETK